LALPVHPTLDKERIAGWGRVIREILGEATR